MCVQTQFVPRTFTHYVTPLETITVNVPVPVAAEPVTRFQTITVADPRPPADCPQGYRDPRNDPLPVTIIETQTVIPDWP